jgi:RNA polymerase sigma-70 factor (ECF subfamily)
MDKINFEILARQLRPHIIKVARSILDDDDDAEDIAQDTLLKLWSMRDRLDQYSDLTALASVIARSRSIDRLRQKRPHGDLPTDIADEQATDDKIIEDENNQRIDSLLASLPDAYQTILKMKHIDEMETSEIAKILGTAEVNVRVTLSRARHRIKELFERTQSI